MASYVHKNLTSNEEIKHQYTVSKMKNYLAILVVALLTTGCASINKGYGYGPSQKTLDEDLSIGFFGTMSELCNEYRGAIRWSQTERQQHYTDAIKDRNVFSTRGLLNGMKKTGYIGFTKQQMECRYGYLMPDGDSHSYSGHYEWFTTQSSTKFNRIMFVDNVVAKTSNY